MISHNKKILSFALAVALGLGACSDNNGNGFTPPPADTTPPVIGVLADVTIEANTGSETVPLSLSDDGSSLSRLSVEVTSNNAMLITDDGIDVENRSALILSPNPDTTGEALITLNVSDSAGNTAMESFTLTVVTREVAAVNLVNEVADLDADDEPVYLNAVDVTGEVSAETGFDALVNQ